MAPTWINFRARSYWALLAAALLIALVSATTIVFTADPLSQVLQQRATIIAGGRTNAMDDYVQGLAKAVPGSVQR